MFHLTFNPGPSQISDRTKQDILEAMQENIASISHRSARFTEVSKAAITGLNSYLSIPDDYRTFYLSSATEAMEVLARNVIERTSFHFVNGSFSELFAQIASLHGKNVIRNEAPWGTMNDTEHANIPTDTELIALTYNETSTGVMCRDEQITALRERHPDVLLCIDITSIAGMKRMNIAEADAWFFSVQKAFGLPSGLGILIVSPRVMEKAKSLRERNVDRAGLFTLAGMEKHMNEKYQTINTPNVLDIFLLSQQLERWNADGGIGQREKEARERVALMDAFLRESSMVSHFVEDASSRSLSVFCLQSTPEHIAHLHAMTLAQGIMLGNGYGKLKEFTVRMANFPAISRTDLQNTLRIFTECEREYAMRRMISGDTRSLLLSRLPGTAAPEIRDDRAHAGTSYRSGAEHAVQLFELHR